MSSQTDTLPAAPASIGSTHPRLLKLADLLFGTDPRLRVRVRLCFLALCMYGVWVGVMIAGLRSDLIVSRPLGLATIALELAAMLAFYPLVRSGRTAHLPDPALVLPQIALAYVACAMNYVAQPDSRGALLQVMCLAQVFGLLSLTPREVSLGGLTAVLSLVAAWIGGVLWAPEPAFNPSVEALHMATAAFILTLLTAMSHRYSLVRSEVRTQKRTLADAVERIEHIVSHDTLTGLYNRHHMVQALERELARLDRSGHNFAVVIVDLDHFKQINDQHGHQVGDEVLESFAAITQEVLRDTDIVGRWGGEEFLLLMPDTNPAERAMVGLNRLRSTLEDTIVSCARPGLRIRYSAGIAIPCKGETVDGVLERADHALYRAKKQGRDRFTVAD